MRTQGWRLTPGPRGGSQPAGPTVFNGWTMCQNLGLAEESADTSAEGAESGYPVFGLSK